MPYHAQVPACIADALRLGLPADLPAEVEDQSRRDLYISATHLACRGSDIGIDQVPNEQVLQFSPSMPAKVWDMTRTCVRNEMKCWCCCCCCCCFVVVVVAAAAVVVVRFLLLVVY